MQPLHKYGEALFDAFAPEQKTAANILKICPVIKHLTANSLHERAGALTQNHCGI